MITCSGKILSIHSTSGLHPHNHVWLVLWNINLIFFIGNFIIPTDLEIFQRAGEKPPTRQSQIPHQRLPAATEMVYLLTAKWFGGFLTQYPTMTCVDVPHLFTSPVTIYDISSITSLLVSNINGLVWRKLFDRKAPLNKWDNLWFPFRFSLKPIHWHYIPHDIPSIFLMYIYACIYIYRFPLYSHYIPCFYGGFNYSAFHWQETPARSAMPSLRKSLQPRLRSLLLAWLRSFHLKWGGTPKTDGI